MVQASYCKGKQSSPFMYFLVGLFRLHFVQTLPSMISLCTEILVRIEKLFYEANHVTKECGAVLTILLPILGPSLPLSLEDCPQKLGLPGLPPACQPFHPLLPLTKTHQIKEAESQVCHSSTVITIPAPPPPKWWQTPTWSLMYYPLRMILFVLHVIMHCTLCTFLNALLVSLPR